MHQKLFKHELSITEIYLKRNIRYVQQLRKVSKKWKQLVWSKDNLWINKIGFICIVKIEIFLNPTIDNLSQSISISTTQATNLLNERMSKSYLISTLFLYLL